MKHPDAPMFPLRREYRITTWPTRYPDRAFFRVEFKTWYGRWKSCSSYYDTKLMAEAELRAIRFGFPKWLPA